MSADRALGLQVGPSRVRHALLLAGCGVLTVTATACESTEQESAKLGREASATGQPAAPKLGAVNRGVEVSDVSLVNGEGRAAVAARLTSRTSRAQLDVPVEVEVRDAAGRILYTNDTAGLEASLQSIAVLSPHASVWWVDDQVSSATGGRSSVSVKVGTGRSARTVSGPLLTTGSLSVGEQSGVSVVSGRLLLDHRQGHVPHGGSAVYVVALRGRRVVAAGRAVAGGFRGAGAKFQAFLVGNPAGAKIEASPGPSAG